MKARITLFLLFFSFTQNAFSQQTYIRGRITDIESQLPLKGASVYINNTTKGSVSDDNGDFELGPLQPGQYDVIASYVGYISLLYSARLNTTTMREVLILTSETRN